VIQRAEVAAEGVWKPGSDEIFHRVAVNFCGMYCDEEEEGEEGGWDLAWLRGLEELGGAESQWRVNVEILTDMPELEHFVESCSVHFHELQEAEEDAFYDECTEPELPVTATFGWEPRLGDGSSIFTGIPQPEPRKPALTRAELDILLLQERHSLRVQSAWAKASRMQNGHLRARAEAAEGTFPSEEEIARPSKQPTLHTTAPG
jgi:hypothetical protein